MADVAIQNWHTRGRNLQHNRQVKSFGNFFWVNGRGRNFRCCIGGRRIALHVFGAAIAGEDNGGADRGACGAGRAKCNR